MAVNSLNTDSRNTHRILVEGRGPGYVGSVFVPKGSRCVNFTLKVDSSNGSFSQHCCIHITKWNETVKGYVHATKWNETESIVAFIHTWNLGRVLWSAHQRGAPSKKHLIIHIILCHVVATKQFRKEDIFVEETLTNYFIRTKLLPLPCRCWINVPVH